MRLREAIETVERWAPPAGVRWELGPHYGKGLIAVRITAGDMATTFIVKRDADDRLRAELEHASLKLAREWERRLGPEPPADWLASTLAKVRALQRADEACLEPGDLALWLLSAIEAQSIPPADVEPYDDDQLLVHWTRGRRVLALTFLNAFMVEIDYWSDDDHLARESFDSLNAIPAVRRALGWISPEANAANPWEFS